jgi:hypothetical protein
VGCVYNLDRGTLGTRDLDDDDDPPDGGVTAGDAYNRIRDIPPHGKIFNNT